MESESDLSELLESILFAGLLFLVIFVTLANYAKSINRLMRLNQMAKVPKNWIKRRTQIFQRQVSSFNKPHQIENPASLRQAIDNRNLRIIRATWVAYGVFVICGFITILILDDAVNTWSDLINPRFIEEHFLVWTEEIILLFLSLCVFSLGPAIINIYPQISMKFLLGGLIPLCLIWALFDGGLVSFTGLPNYSFAAIDVLESALDIFLLCFLILYRLTVSVQRYHLKT